MAAHTPRTTVRESEPYLLEAPTCSAPPRFRAWSPPQDRVRTASQGSGRSSSGATSTHRDGAGRRTRTAAAARMREPARRRFGTPSIGALSLSAIGAPPLSSPQLLHSPMLCICIHIAIVFDRFPRASTGNMSLRATVFRLRCGRVSRNARTLHPRATDLLAHT